MATVTATYVTAAGGPAVGTIYLSPVIRAPHGDTIVVERRVYADLDAGGAVAVDVTPTDDGQWSVDGEMAYLVEERIVGLTFRSYYITVPSTGVDLADVQIAEPDVAVKPVTVIDTGGGGGVTDHGALSGLADDDHPHYLTKVRPFDGESFFIDPDTEWVGRWDVVDDGSGTGDWPDRLSFRFNGVRTGSFNEYGEIRVEAALGTTVAMRAHGTAGGANPGVPIFAVRTERGGDDIFIVPPEGPQVANTPHGALPLMPTWVGTQAEYDALAGTEGYSDTVRYEIVG